MVIKLLNKDYIESALNLYEDIRKHTYTFWDDGYPSRELIEWDIERKGLFGAFENEELIAIAFLGERCEDGEENFTWKDSFIRRGTFARIGVSPKHQNKGIGTKMVEFILNELKKRGFDGVRILVGKNNENAKKLYKKFGFYNCGEVNKYNHDYCLYELRLIKKV